MLRVGERVEEAERSTCLPFPLLWCQSPSGAPKRRRLRMKGGEEGRVRSASHSQHPRGLFICRCLHRKRGCSEAPLTRSSRYHQAGCDCSAAPSITVHAEICRPQRRRGAERASGDAGRGRAAQGDETGRGRIILLSQALKLTPICIS